MRYIGGVRFVPFLMVLVASFLSAESIRVGVASGFPPYQYEKNGHPAGLDVELTEALAAELGVSVIWIQAPWDNLTARLRLTKELDLLVGMEKTTDRQRLYLLGRDLYTRKNLLFLRAEETSIQKLEDLTDRLVARDRDSYSEELLSAKGLRTEVRMVKTDTKEEAFAALVAGRVVAAFMPEAVGHALAQQAGVAVRTLDFGDPGTAVGLAFPKNGGDGLLRRFDEAATRLEKSGALAKLLIRYRAR